MNLFIRMITIVTMGIGFTVPSDHINNEAVIDTQTKKVLEQLYEQDLAGEEMPTYQFLTQELSNHYLNEEEARNQDILVSDEEKKLLARLVSAEAKGEPYKGKVAVAEVVLNRVEHEQFPDSIKEVIYEENQFEPVRNNSIQQPAGQEAIKAVEEALHEQENQTEALYFYNPDTASDNWIRDREVITKIGNHVFAN
ncbi:cell wall hydrolase [Bacillus pinisoli]|uniref:cell wall hydrolase n=1 Tax=Bacillus pinisoli TaxID=2901866 RepID=UPI001FF53AF8|nr:cell wall hydrolase [Bacillus pinisoli]